MLVDLNTTYILARESWGNACALIPNVLPALKTGKMINHDADDVRNLKRETVEQVDERKFSQNCIITVWESSSRVYKKRMMEWMKGIDRLNRLSVFVNSVHFPVPLCLARKTEECYIFRANAESTRS